jgi:hypothetical protein
MKLIKFAIALAIFAAPGFTALTGYGLVKDNDVPVCNLNDYVITSQSGRNGEGNLSMEVDTERLIADYGQYLRKPAENMPDWVQQIVAPIFSEESIEMAFKGLTFNNDARAYYIVLSQETGLSNGDEVIVQWNDLPATVGALKLVLPVRFEYAPFSYTVENLNTVETIQADITEIPEA